MRSLRRLFSQVPAVWLPKQDLKNSHSRLLEYKRASILSKGKELDKAAHSIYTALVEESNYYACKSIPLGGR